MSWNLQTLLTVPSSIYRNLSSTFIILVWNIKFFKLYIPFLPETILQWIYTFLTSMFMWQVQYIEISEYFTRFLIDWLITCSYQTYSVNLCWDRTPLDIWSYASSHLWTVPHIIHVWKHSACLDRLVPHQVWAVWCKAPFNQCFF